MKTETNNNADSAHHALGEKTHWSNVRVAATKASAGIEEDVCAEQKMKGNESGMVKEGKGSNNTRKGSVHV